jgi:hypothetical protein
MERQRGQTLPLWIGGILVTLALMFFTLNYANMIRWQIRAQNAADAAASGLLAIQTSNWNRMQIMLYASAVEEFRIRRLIDAIVVSANRSGNCRDAAWPELATASPVPTGNSCLADYLALKTALNRAVTRYSTDVQMLHNFTFKMTKGNIESDMRTMLTHVQSHCFNQPGGGGGIEGVDCAFNYSINAIGGRTDLQGVAMDAYVIQTPRIVNGTMAGLVTGFSVANINQNLWLPERVDIVACATIPPLVPGLTNIIRAVPFQAVGRSAATSVQVLQDWLQPGLVGDPAIAGGAAFQASENPSGEQLGGNDNPYFTINYGGNNNIVYPQYRGFLDPIANDEFSVQMGWWGSVPIKPFGAAIVPGTTLACPVPDPRL